MRLGGTHSHSFQTGGEIVADVMIVILDEPCRSWLATVLIPRRHSLANRHGSALPGPLGLIG
jgi:hypothetical protein